MAKFEIEMELTGLKIKVRGERSEDMPHLTGQISKQLAGLVQPPAAMIEEPSRRAVEAIVRQPENGQGQNKGNGRAKATRRKSAANGDAAPIAPATWQHDPAKWGMPKQATWSGGQKILWVLYVIGKETGQTEISGPGIAETFNTLFKQFGPLAKQNMPRDLGALKKRTPALVIDNATQSPITWYLTEEGIKEAEKLVTEAKGASGTAQQEA